MLPRLQAFATFCVLKSNVQTFSAFCSLRLNVPITKSGLRNRFPMNFPHMSFSSASPSIGTDWTPQVVKVAKVHQHPNADMLDIAYVQNDYPVVVARNEYSVNSLASYIPIDTVLPDTELFHFLSPRATEKFIENGEVKARYLDTPKFSVGNVPEKNRIVKAKKIRGIYSQGLLMPCPPGMVEGDSVIESFGLTKWKEDDDDDQENGPESPPSGWDIPHYDIQSVRRYIDCIKDGEEIVLTEKIHGSNAAFVHDGARLWVKSRNLFKKKNKADFWWDVALRYDLETKLLKFPNMVLFGEIYGKMKRFKYDTIAGNGKKAIHKVLFFDVWDLSKQQFLDYDERVRMIKECGLENVPVLYRGPWLGKDKMYEYAEGITTLGKHVREGWVLNTVKERVNSDPLQVLQGNSRMQFKLVSEAYNLQK